MGPIKLDKQDERDVIYEFKGIAIPAKYNSLAFCTPVKDQEKEGACVGFGGCATFETLYAKKYGQNLDLNNRSERYYYTNAQLFDEIPGEAYEGSSIKGGIRGLHKKGLCHEKCWPYVSQNKGAPIPGFEEDANKFTISRYFRIYEKNWLAEMDLGPNQILNVDELKLQEEPFDVIVDIAKIKEAIYLYGALNVATVCHTGWFNAESSGNIPLTPDHRVIGAHAISFIGYDDEKQAFLLKNSWGEKWAKNGYAYQSYADAMEHVMSIWGIELA